MRHSLPLSVVCTTVVASGPMGNFRRVGITFTSLPPSLPPSSVWPSEANNVVGGHVLQHGLPARLPGIVHSGDGGGGGGGGGGGPGSLLRPKFSLSNLRVRRRAHNGFKGGLYSKGSNIIFPNQALQEGKD